ncbi:hypothetical protein ABZX75_20105 [Streptomyces sp. NPDC003038]|uniref:hypothetical protein n=1 Tax=unclassified Streptomyces TaxID=2593676 RepID=UPI0033BD423C
MSRTVRIITAAAFAALLVGGASATASADSGWGAPPADNGWNTAPATIDGNEWDTATADADGSRA